jgi:hypothetical protein
MGKTGKKLVLNKNTVKRLEIKTNTRAGADTDSCPPSSGASGSSRLTNGASRKDSTTY